MIVPKDWSKVNITQYEAVYEIMREPIKDELDRLTRYMTVLEIVSGKELDEIRKMPIDRLLKVKELLNTEIPSKIPEWIKLRDNYYKLITDPTKVDANRYMMIMNAVKSEKINQMLFSVFIPYAKILGKPIELDAEQTKERLEHFKELPVTLAMPVKVFFCNVSKHLTEIILKFSEETLKGLNEKIKAQTDSIKNMAG